MLILYLRRLKYLKKDYSKYIYIFTTEHDVSAGTKVSCEDELNVKSITVSLLHFAVSKVDPCLLVLERSIIGAENIRIIIVKNTVRKFFLTILNWKIIIAEHLNIICLN